MIGHTLVEIIDIAFVYRFVEYSRTLDIAKCVFVAKARVDRPSAFTRSYYIYHANAQIDCGTYRLRKATHTLQIFTCFESWLF